jgi:serine/threonine protein phosphatase PrpC
VDHSWGYGSEQQLREKNEDCYGVFDFPEYTLALVCDGMGGHVGGAYASALAVRTIHDAMRDAGNEPAETALERAIQRTNVSIYEAARKNHRLMGMGTTVVAAVISRDTCVLAHVGDSRAYLIRRGSARPMTRDHTMVNLFVDAELLSPEDAATHPEAHVLSRSLGIERSVEVDVSEVIHLEPGDVVFLCSDGVHGVALERELATMDWSAPHDAVQEILRIVAARAGDDNATAVAVMMGTSVEDVPPTGVPEARRLDDVPPGMSNASTVVPFEGDYDPVDGTPATLGNDPTRSLAYSPPPADGTPVQAQPEQIRNAPPAWIPPAPPRPTAGATPGWDTDVIEPEPNLVEPRKTAPAKPAKAKTQSAGRSYLVPMLAVSVVLLGVVICGIGTLLFADMFATPGQAVVSAPPSAPTEAVPAPEPVPDTCDQWPAANGPQEGRDNAGTMAAIRQVLDGCQRPEVLDPALLQFMDLARREMLAIGHGLSEPPRNAEPTGTVAAMDGGRVPVYALSDDRLRFVESVDAVLSHTFVADPVRGADLAKRVADQRPQLLLHTGQVLCAHHQFSAALPRLQELQERYPDSPEAKVADTLRIDCRRPPNDRDGDGVNDDIDLCPAIADPTQLDADADGVGDACEDDQMVCPSEEWLVKLVVPPAPGRLPRSAQECTQPPPGGAEQQRAIQFARTSQCAASLDEVQKAMDISPDHCTLYKMAWPCFRAVNVDPLIHRDKPVQTWDDLVLLLPHLNGARAEHEAQLQQNPSLAQRPDWSRPATSGIEYRLEAWERSELMQRYLSDLYGEPQVADELGKDLYVEAQIAVGLACAPPEKRTPVMESAWARRVYVLARALSGPSGAIIAHHRDDLTPRLRSALALAVTERVGPDGRIVPVPGVVRDAYDAGTGNRPIVPIATPKPAGKPKVEDPTIPYDPGLELHDPKKGRTSGAGQ